MTSKEFTIWLKGFMTACNEYSPTPKQWDIIKEELDKVSDNIAPPIGVGGWGTPNTGAPSKSVPTINPTWIGDPPGWLQPYTTWDYPTKYGTTTPPPTITTTPGTGYITTFNPVQFGTGSFFPITSTTMFPISGSNVTYTNGGNGLKD